MCTSHIFWVWDVNTSDLQSALHDLSQLELKEKCKLSYNSQIFFNFTTDSNSLNVSICHYLHLVAPVCTYTHHLAFCMICLWTHFSQFTFLFCTIKVLHRRRCSYSHLKSKLEISLHSTFPRCKMHLIYSWIHLWCCQVPISWQMDWHPFSLACLQFSYTWQWTFGNFQIVNLLFFKKMTIAIACLTPQIQTAN